jgi:hypothetical protein
MHHPGTAKNFSVPNFYSIVRPRQASAEYKKTSVSRILQNRPELIHLPLQLRQCAVIVQHIVAE